jgi:hypothetical protein
MKKLILSILPLLLGLGCTTGKHYVVAGTGTVIGLEIAQSETTQMYNAKLGYDRAEIAIVPSNRASGQKGDVTTGGGASDTTDVLMELHYANIFSLQSSGIYQRLAVGKNAVMQPGAAFMFAKSKDGQLDPAVAASVAKAVGTIPAVQPEITAQKATLTETYLKEKTTQQIKYDKAAQAAGFKSFDAFLIDPNTTQAQFDQVKKGLQ